MQKQTDCSEEVETEAARYKQRGSVTKHSELQTLTALEKSLAFYAMCFLIHLIYAPSSQFC